MKSSEKQRQRQWNMIKAYMKQVYNEHREPLTGQILATSLAEDTAHHFNSSHWLDNHLHPVWDAAVEIAIEYQ
jgi:hypothetical protein